MKIQAYALQPAPNGGMVLKEHIYGDWVPLETAQDLASCLKSAVRELLEKEGEESDDKAVDDWISIWYDAAYE